MFIRLWLVIKKEEELLHQFQHVGRVALNRILQRELSTIETADLQHVPYLSRLPGDRGIACTKKRADFIGCRASIGTVAEYEVDAADGINRGGSPYLQTPRLQRLVAQVTQFLHQLGAEGGTLLVQVLVAKRHGEFYHFLLSFLQLLQVHSLFLCTFIHDVSHNKGSQISHPSKKEIPSRQG